MSSPTRRVAPLPLLLLLACGGNGSPEGASTDSGSAPEGSGGGVFYGDVGAVFAERCNACHTAGSVAPFALDDAEQAVAWAPALMSAIEARTMPPYPANHDGSCQTFQNAHWMPDDEIALVRGWVDAGAPVGEPADLPPARQFDDLAGQRIVDVVPGPDYSPVVNDAAGGRYDDYQCFLVDPDQDGIVYMTGYEVVVDNTDILHHVIAFKVDASEVVGYAGGQPVTNASQMASLDAATPDQLGWDCTGAAGSGVIPSGVPISWAPGGGAMNYPDGTGIRFGPNDKLVVQIHYNVLDDAPATDSSGLRLAFADEVEREGHMDLYDDFLASAYTNDPETLPPGETHASFSWSAVLKRAYPGVSSYDEVEVMAIFPHMHTLGRTLRASLTYDDQEDCAIDVDRWDFNWQFAYWYDQPLRVPSGARLNVTCEWDTTEQTQPVSAGFGTDEEMCLVGLYMVEAQ